MGTGRLKRISRIWELAALTCQPNMGTGRSIVSLILTTLHSLHPNHTPRGLAAADFRPNWTVQALYSVASVCQPARTEIAAPGIST